MLDHVCIFTKGGSLLWVLSFVGLKGDPINTLIRACLLEERAGQSSFEYIIPSGGTYALKWSLNNVRLAASADCLDVDLRRHCAWGARGPVGSSRWRRLHPRRAARLTCRQPAHTALPCARLACRGWASCLWQSTRRR